jgi:RND family efflux transporter MFP subunit
MNKYVLRTSLVWLCGIALVAGAFFYKSRRAAVPAHSEDQPVAVGPASEAETGSTNTQPASERSLSPVQLTPEGIQNINVKTGVVQWKQIGDDIRATGTVDIDERLVSYVQVRFPGYIRKVFANATYQYVRRGQPLFSIYSPELVATEQDYLLARKNEKELSTSSVDGVSTAAVALSEAAEARLQQWEIPQSAIQQLNQSGKPITDFVVSSPVTGYITERNALPSMYIQPASRLYTVADLSTVWVYAQVFQDDVGRLKPGDPVQITVDSYPGRAFRARTESILPQVDVATRTVRVRIAMPNPGMRLKPGMFVNAAFKVNLGKQLVVPASAVFQSGTRQLVFLDHGAGSYEPKEVVTGLRAGDDVAIVKGLAANQRIVTSANFLIDSETQLQAAAGSYTPPPPGAGAQRSPSNTPQASIEFTTAPDPPRKGTNTFRVKLSGPNSTPVSGADVSVTFFMPAMPAMGMAAMNTTAKLNDKGNGIYEGTGVLRSGGTWQVTVKASKDGRAIATKQVRVNAQGGM